jgi:hypothetical protein
MHKHATIAPKLTATAHRTARTLTILALLALSSACADTLGPDAPATPPTSTAEAALGAEEAAAEPRLSYDDALEAATTRVPADGAIEFSVGSRRGYALLVPAPLPALIRRPLPEGEVETLVAAAQLDRSAESGLSTAWGSPLPAGPRRAR